MKLESISGTAAAEDLQEDYQLAKRVEQYRVGQKALYFTGFFSSRCLPYRAVQRVWLKNASLPVTGSCGKALPIVVLRIQYDGGFYQNVTFEKRRSAQTVLDRITGENPSAEIHEDPAP